ncbi:MAG: DivIVA domain-containing protein [Bacilli bacterium]|nr:DivIVA domain-containing protein [Bacilli bacterium]MDD4809098.1 DivIVA domain-containing protein [Bacilli bacterium]
MEKFSRTLRGYDPEEVNAFLDQIINQVEKMVSEIKEKDEKINKLSVLAEENQNLKDKLEQYERLESTLNRAIFMAQKTSDQIKIQARQESETLIQDAKNNANRIINEALLRSDKVEIEATMLKRNVNLFKRKLRSLIEQQLEMVDDIDQVEF